MELEENADDNVVGSRNEIERLSKLNFNMKLRIFYLEERLSKLNSNANDDAEDLAQENLDLKMLVEEKQRDLEDRNQLLVKARNAIEGLQTENTLVKAELAEQRNKCLPTQALVSREKEIQSLKKENEEIAEERDALKIGLDKAAKDLKEAQTELASKDVILAEVQTQLQLAKSEILAQKSLVETLQANEAASRKRSIEETSNRGNLEKQVKRLEDALTDALDAKSGLESELLHLTAALKKHEERETELLVNHGQKVQQLTAKCNNLEAQLESQRKEFVNTVVSLETKEKEVESLKSEINRFGDVESETREAKAQLHTAQDKISTLQLQCKEQALQLQQDFKLERSADRLTQESQRKELQAQLKYMEEQYASVATQLDAERTRCKELQVECANGNSKISRLGEENAVLTERFKSLKRESGVKEDSLRLQVQSITDERIRQLETSVHEKQVQLQSYQQTIEELTAKVKEVERSAIEDHKELEDSICNRIDTILAFPRSLPSFEPGRNEPFEIQPSTIEQPLPLSGGRALRKLSQVQNIYQVFTQHIKAYYRRLEVEFAKLEASVQGKENRVRNVEVQLSVHNHTKTRDNQGLIQEHALILSQLRKERQKALEDLRECEKEREKALLESQRMSLELETLQQKMQSNEHGLERLKSTTAEELEQLQESNRLMSLELEDRAKRLEMCRSSAENASHEIRLLKQETELKDKQIQQLKESLEHKRKQLRANAKKLKDYPQFVATTANAHAKQPDDFERNILEQVKETERAIVLSNDQRRENELLSNHNLLEQVKRCEERFADVMVAASELVRRCEQQFVHASNAQPNEVRRIFHSNALLASQLQDLGFEVQTLFRKIGRLERLDSGKLNYKNSPLRMFSTPRKWKTTEAGGVENATPNRTTQTINPYSYETPRGKSNLTSNVSTVEKLHKDMLVRLGKIGSDLQATAAALRLT